MHQQKKWTQVARLCMTLALLVGWGGAPVAKAAQIGAGTVAVYHQGGKEPPVWAKKQYEARRQCQCGDASFTEVTAYSEYSLEDAEKWAEAACFNLCLQKKWPRGEPFGMWGVIPVTAQEPLGMVEAIAPDFFAAYLPDQDTPVAQSKDPVALALQLMSLTKVPAVMLAGPGEFFAQAPQCLAP